MYDRVFEYLLRMKGNYIWPAMWTSSFLLDGSGMASMELADEYGIYVGMSHHEPCMRSSEEWDLVKGKDTPYGIDWSYVTNKEGLLRYWEDGLKRSMGHHVFPTIGMRGERDSKMLGDDAAVSENVRLLKEIITRQRGMISEYLEEDGEKVPQLFAVYKEVEDYYFGDGRTEGLRDFEGLDGVTLLLCEDNFGSMRALPNEAERTREGGFGMYYHLDYHGEPVSYEWMPSVPLSRIWEQMTEAYEYGVRELWIVNVGDLKFQEYPLGFFMEMAYDFDTWGSAASQSAKRYAREWAEKVFGADTSGDERERILRVLETALELNGLRRPESLNDTIYHPAHYMEGRRMLAACQALEQENEELRRLLKGRNGESAYESMVYYPAAASANLLKMHLYSGLNHLYARQGKAAANQMGERMEECVLRDEKLMEGIAAFRDGKWSGMERASHIGFTNWNDEDWRYPVRHVVRLPEKPRLVVSRADETAHFTNQYFPKPLQIEVLLDEREKAGDSKQVILEIANGGQGTLDWRIEADCDWLTFSQISGKTGLQDEVALSFKRSRLPLEEEVECDFVIRAGQESVPVHVRAWKKERTGLPEKTFYARGVQGGTITMDAVHYAEKHSGMYEGREASFEELADYGKYGSGVKVFPSTASFTEEKDAPSLTYQVWADHSGRYRLELHTSPANPLVYGGSLHLAAAVDEEKTEEAEITGGGYKDPHADEFQTVKEVEIVGAGYKGGEPGCQAWEQAALNQEHAGEITDGTEPNPGVRKGSRACAGAPGTAPGRRRKESVIPWSAGEPQDMTGQENVETTARGICGAAARREQKEGSMRRDREQARRKAEELVDQMTVEEMAGQLMFDAPAIERLGVPAYNWWNEGLHGVARAGTATIFPQAIGLAAAWDTELMHAVGSVTAEEARAKYNASIRYGDHGIYKGLTLWAPNVNIFRDPRWGRGHETYGEDPILTGRLAVAMIRGMQGDGEYLKTAACAKHFAVHSGPEALRHSFNAVAGKKDLYETYLPAFEACVKEADVEAVMGAYNRTNGEACCASQELIGEILRGKWEFQGHYVSDCWAIRDFHEHHGLTRNGVESSAMALNAGCDLNCGCTYLCLKEAYRKHLFKKETLKKAAVRLFTTRYLLGMFTETEYDRIPYTSVESPEHLELSRRAAEEGMVLLKNDGILPLDKKEVKIIGIVGPNADNRSALDGNYHGTSSRYVTALEGIQDYVGEGARILYSQGCHLFRKNTETLGQEQDRISEALAVAEHSDVVILCLGLDETLEGEEGDTGNAYASGDKEDLRLPEGQRRLTEAVLGTGKPVVVCVFSGSALDLSLAQEKAAAVIQAWYPGSRGGSALARILFGEVSPCGKLPVTFYRSLDGLPDFTDYSMEGRTYRYLTEEPLYPFGYGLTYGDIRVKEAEFPDRPDREKDLRIRVVIRNEGGMRTKDVIQVYIKNEGTKYAPPHPVLCGFMKTEAEAGEEKVAELLIPKEAFTVVNDDGERILDGVSSSLYVGTSAPDARSMELTGKTVVSSRIMWYHGGRLYTRPEQGGEQGCKFMIQSERQMTV